MSGKKISHEKQLGGHIDTWMELIFQAYFGSAGAELGYDLTASQAADLTRGKELLKSVFAHCQSLNLNHTPPTGLRFECLVHDWWSILRDYGDSGEWSFAGESQSLCGKRALT